MRSGPSSSKKTNVHDRSVVTRNNNSARRGTKQQSKAVNNPLHRKSNNASSSSGRRFKATLGLRRTKDEDGDDQYVSFDDIRRTRYSSIKQHSKKEEQLVNSNFRHHRLSSRSVAKLSFPSPSPPRGKIHVPTDIVIDTSLSDESSLITIDDSLATLEGLSITLPPQPVGHAEDRFRAVQFKRVVMVHTYDTDERPICTRDAVACLSKEPTVVRKLGLYERIALYEQRPDLAPFYNNPWATDINNKVLAPIVSAGRKNATLPGDKSTVVQADSAMTRPGDICHQEAREYNDPSSLLDVGGEDSRDEIDEDIRNVERDDEGSVRSDRKEVDVAKMCHLYGPVAFNCILGCVTGE